MEAVTGVMTYRESLIRLVPGRLQQSVRTSVMMEDGQTFCIGGLIQSNVLASTTKLPVLGDIPGLGYLFRSNGKKRDKRNLILFITPTIVTDEDFSPTQSDFLRRKPPVDRSDSDEVGFDNLLDSAKPHDWSKPIY